MMVKCKKCRKETKHPRRGMCLNCYRKVTGFSKGKPLKPKPRLKPVRPVKSKPIKIKKIMDADDLETVPSNWWKKYLEADILEQQRLLASLTLVRELSKNGFPDISRISSESYKGLSQEELAKKQEEFNSYMLVTMLYSYIQDLIELMPYIQDLIELMR